MSRALKAVVVPLCPVLFAVFPVLSLYAQNKADVELSLLWPSLLACAGGAMGIFAMFLLLTRRAAAASVASTVLVVAVLYYGLLFDQRPTWVAIGWLVVAFGGVVAALRQRGQLLPLVVVLAVGATVMVLPQATSVALYRAHHAPVAAADPRLWPTALSAPQAAATRPDIFVLMPDDYARADVLAQYFHYDNSDFLAQLEQRGFVVSDQARSPYAYSELNMASALNLDYLSNWPKVVGRHSQDIQVVKRVMEDNRAARLLTSIGYDYVHLDTDEVTFAGGNPDISPFASPDSFANLWLGKSILQRIGGPLGFNEQAMNQRFRQSIRSVFSELRSIRGGTRPKFVVFHTLMPHDPFVFAADGRSVTFPADGDHTGRIGMRYYVEGLQYLNRQLLQSIDAIRANAKSPPVIVIQADEGFEVNPDLVGESTAEDLRVKGLAALALPGLTDPGVPTPPNSVNTLRFVFNHYLGTALPMLETRSHLEGDQPYDFTEITVR